MSTRQKLFVTKILVLIVFSANVLYAEIYDTTWQRISEGDSTYDIHLVRTNAALDLSDLPLHFYSDLYIESIYVKGQLGNTLDSEIALSKTIAAQNAMKIANAGDWIMNRDHFISSYDFEKEISGGITFVAPKYTQSWWRGMYIYGGAMSLGLEGIASNPSHRTKVYKEVFLDAVLQNEYIEEIFNSTEYSQMLATLIQINNYTGDAASAVDVLMQATNVYLNKGHLISFISQSLNGNIPSPKISHYLGQLNVVVDSLDAIIDIGPDTVRYLFRQVCANAKAEEKLLALQEFINTHPELDSSLKSGFELAKNEFYDIQESYYNNGGLSTALSNSIVNAAIDLDFLYAAIAGWITGLPILQWAGPWLLSYNMYMDLREKIIDVQRLTLGATLVDAIYETEYLSESSESIANAEVISNEEVRNTLNLLNVCSYLSWYAYKKYEKMVSSN